MTGNPLSGREHVTRQSSCNELPAGICRGGPMSVLTLVRHAQASFHADDYDELSALGREQARLLGEFWARRRADFDAVYCGPRVRQRHTAEIAGAAFAEAGRTWPE